MVEQMKVALATVRIESFSFDMARADYRELADGHPYALVPTELIAVDPNGGRTRFARRRWPCSTATAGI